MSPGGLAGHSAALIGSFELRCGIALEASASHEDRRASDLGHAEIEGSEPSPGTSGFSRRFDANRRDASLSSIRTDGTRLTSRFERSRLEPDVSYKAPHRSGTISTRHAAVATRDVDHALRFVTP